MGVANMKNGRLISAFVSLIISSVFLAIPAGNTYAMPLNTALNYGVEANPSVFAPGDFSCDIKPDLSVINSGNNNASRLLYIQGPEVYGAETNTLGTIITINFSADMADPSGNQANFIYKINGGAAQNFSAAALNALAQATCWLTLIY